MRANLKESGRADLPAGAWFITNVDERRRVLSALEMVWYQRQVASVEVVEVLFDRRASDDLVATF